MHKLENRQQPLGECFGFRINDTSPEARAARKAKTCPYGNAKPECTKVSKTNPLAVCSLYHRSETVVVCPVRFRQTGLIYKDAAEFFFKSNKFIPLREVKIRDAKGGEAGNIDVVIARVDGGGAIIDFGALEVQSVYLSGNGRLPFDHFMADPDNRGGMSWVGEKKYPRPDWLSSTRKRLAPQLLYKGGILRSWGKKMAVAMDIHLFSTMPELPYVSQSEAEIAWLLYDLKLNRAGRYDLVRVDTKYTKFEPTLATITKCEPGDMGKFIISLEAKRKRVAKAAKKSGHNLTPWII